MLECIFEDDIKTYVRTLFWTIQNNLLRYESFLEKYEYTVTVHYDEYNDVYCKGFQIQNSQEEYFLPTQEVKNYHLRSFVASSCPWG